MCLSPPLWSQKCQRLHYVGRKIFRNNIEIGTFMIKFYLFALNTQEIKIGIILVLCHTEYLPLFKFKHKFSMTLILLQRGKQVRICITAVLLSQDSIHLPIGSSLDSAFVDVHSESQEAEVVVGMVS